MCVGKDHFANNAKTNSLEFLAGWPPYVQFSYSIAAFCDNNKSNNNKLIQIVCSGLGHRLYFCRQFRTCRLRGCCCCCRRTSSALRPAYRTGRAYVFIFVQRVKWAYWFSAMSFFLCVLSPREHEARHQLTSNWCAGVPFADLYRWASSMQSAAPYCSLLTAFFSFSRSSISYPEHFTFALLSYYHWSPAATWPAGQFIANTL